MSSIGGCDSAERGRPDGNVQRWQALYRGRMALRTKSSQRIDNDVVDCKLTKKKKEEGRRKEGRSGGGAGPAHVSFQPSSRVDGHVVFVVNGHHLPLLGPPSSSRTTRHLHRHHSRHRLRRLHRTTPLTTLKARRTARCRTTRTHAAARTTVAQNSPSHVPVLDSLGSSTAHKVDTRPV